MNSAESHRDAGGVDEPALLAGDIGGTKTVLAVFSDRLDVRKPLAQSVFSSAKFPSLEAMVREFLHDTGSRVQRASFGVAGPVVDGTARVTNLPWVMDEKRLSDSLSIPRVTLLNDLEAIAHGVPYLEAKDTHSLNTGRAIEDGTLAVVAPGTGLGEGFLTWEGRRYRVHASEGGHADFAPVDELQLELLRYLLARDEHVSYERVCSGIGIPNIFAFLRDRGKDEVPGDLAQNVDSASDPTPVIVQAGLASEHGICASTLDIFVAILGAEAGNMALKVMATGGVYLGGGIPPRVLKLLQKPRFMESFLSKGRFNSLLRDIPVHVILHPQIALLGAAYHGLEVVQD
ncbi:MAG: glucokinase [Chloroflexota bacterium]